MEPRLLIARTLTACALAIALAQPARAQAPVRAASPALVSPAQVVEQFHAALAAGDSSAAAALLDTGAVILESGDLETRAEYLAHHLPADIEFARAVRSVRQLRRAEERDGTAWVVSTSRATGEFKGRAVDGDGAELIVLARSEKGWRIVAIHWSSHRHR
ncbi:MAG TPA: nuclear transport factor 2 family protein [Gemmatimonadaceae bacterium]|nr:nuclear transport factor 2 family protein [Gemmatimonadaceae bacterium]